MLTREDQERRETDWLAPWAMRSAESRGRRTPEQPHPYRTAFQRDRDRIIHSTAYRRLEYKTQVFVNHEGDYYRTRLTHTMEVAQISRTVARSLRLNEDLCECLALAHDLGHPPFGHAGEDELSRLMEAHGGFEHNAQTLRIVELLERRYPAFPGLNLTWEVRESIVKHEARSRSPHLAEYEPESAPLLEAQVVDLCDAVAYDNHDLDDGVKAGLVVEAELDQVTLWRHARRKVTERYGELDATLSRLQTVLFLINLEVTNLLEETARRLRDHGVQSAADVRKLTGTRLVAFTAEMEEMRQELRAFLFERFYRHYRVVRMAEKAKRFVRDLFQEFTTRPEQMPPQFQAWGREVGVPRCVADYIAGMTDRFAQEEVRKLFNPFERV